MRKRLFACSAVSLAVAVPASASGPRIAHSPVGCVVAERFPRIGAGVTPEDRVARTRVYFRASGTPHWYFVDMVAETGTFWAALPKPKTQTAGVDYYIEATDRDQGVARTAEFSARVVSGPEGCGRDALLAGTVASAVVKVGTAVGASALPPGFGSPGVVLLGTGATAAGGVSTTTLVLGAAGVGVGVAAAVVLAGDGAAPSSAAPPAAAPDTTFTRYYGDYTVTYRSNPSSQPGCFDSRSLGTFVTTLRGDANGANFSFQQSPGLARLAGTIQPDGRFQAAQADGVLTTQGQTDGTRITGSMLTAYCRSDYDGSR
jgi:hypothetical protein